MIANPNQDDTGLDLAVIGGGPAGISACLQPAKYHELTAAFFENDFEIGGMPKTGHFPFGMRDLKGIHRGSSIFPVTR